MLKKIILSQKRGYIKKRIISIIICSLLVMLLMSCSGKSTKPDDGIDVMGIINFGGEKWISLKVEDDRILMISQSPLFTMTYHNEVEHVTWEESNLRKHLNGAFYDSFNAASRAMILPVTNENLDNQWYKTNGGNNTEDKIFLLSLDEICTYFGNHEQLNNPPDPLTIYINHIDDEFNDLRIAKDKNGKPSQWWLRSPGVNGLYASFVESDGRIDVYGNHIRNADSNNIGVRPVMWISRK